VTRRARCHFDFFRQRIERVHRGDVVTGRAFEFGVARKFVPESGGRITLAPRLKHNFVGDVHRRGDARIEVAFRFGRFYFVTGRAARRRGRNAGFGRMARETLRVTERRRFESSFFQPEGVA
jgi:hypothetical protein